MGAMRRRVRGRRDLLLGVLLDVVDGVLDGADLLRVLVRDVDLERLFEREHELDEAERVGAEVVDEGRLGLDVLLFDVELLLDDALDPRWECPEPYACLVSRWGIREVKLDVPGAPGLYTER